MSKSNPVSRARFARAVNETIARIKTMGYDWRRWTMFDVFGYMAYGTAPAFELVDSETIY